MADIDQLTKEYADAVNYRSPWDAEWKSITEYLLPGRGVYKLYNKPQVRKFVSAKAVNTTGREALQVLTSGFHGGLTSPSIRWFDLKLRGDERLSKIRPITLWLEECTQTLYDNLESSNFYHTVHSFYTEFGGFGNAVMYCGEDSESPFRFELLTVGEYAFTLNAQGKVDKFFRTLYKTARNLVEKFPTTVSRTTKELSVTSPETYIIIHQAVIPEDFNGKPFTSVYWESGISEPLLEEGFNEFPYLIARSEIIGSDIYGTGLGSHALPDIKRLQEMEKAFLMAAHKAIDPPLNAPARKRGKIKTFPSAINYYRNPQELVTPMMNVKFDFNGILTAITRTEERIKQKFFNDIFLTASRDPNASPLKATEVMERKEEKLLRLGPVIERLLSEFIAPLVERCFNISVRKGLMPELSPEYFELLKGYTVTFTSPLAQAQKLIASRPINSFLQFAGAAAQFSPEVLDWIDGDKLIEEYAYITGVPKVILRNQEEVSKLREDRRKAQQAEKEKQDAIINNQMQLSQQQQQADIAQTYSEAGVNLGEAIGGQGV